MYCTQPYGARDDLGITIAALVASQQPDLLPTRYRPLIGMIASPSKLADGRSR